MEQKILDNRAHSFETVNRKTDFDSRFDTANIDRLFDINNIVETSRLEQQENIIR